MSAFAEGQRYSLYGPNGAVVVCVRHYTAGVHGTIEMVDLQYEEGIGAGDSTLSPYFGRQAWTVAGVVFPRVTDTLGGVCRPCACHHEHFGRAKATAGPYAGRVCCTSCGAPPEDWPYRGQDCECCAATEAA